MQNSRALADQIRKLSGVTARLARACVAWFQGHAIPSSTYKIAVMKRKAVIESARACIRLRAASANPPLREREFLRSINSFKCSAPRSIYMLQKLIKAAYLLLSARSTIYPLENLEKSNLA
jgi:hypothetical protein